MSDTKVRLHTVAEAAEQLQCTEDWLLKKLRARAVPGRKRGRTWMMAPADIEAAIESMAMPAIAAAPDPAGLTRTSRRRHTRRRVEADRLGFPGA